MAITTLAQLTAALASAQKVSFVRTGSLGTTALTWADLIAVAGTPSAGTLAGSSTAAGVVPTDATSGLPAIDAFGAGNTGYLAGCRFYGAGTSNPGGARVRVGDLLFKAGAYTFNANVTLAAQPSYSSRIPGADYKGTEIWVEAATTFTGIPVFTVGYTNQDGTAGRSIAYTAPAAPTLGRMYQIPLQAGDTGVQQITSVQCGTATVGTFNVLVIRPLWQTWIPASGENVIHGTDYTDLPIIFADSALLVQMHPNLTVNSTFAFELLMDVINA